MYYRSLSSKYECSIDLGIWDRFHQSSANWKTTGRSIHSRVYAICSCQRNMSQQKAMRIPTESFEIFHGNVRRWRLTTQSFQCDEDILCFNFQFSRPSFWDFFCLWKERIHYGFFSIKITGSEKFTGFPTKITHFQRWWLLVSRHRYALLLANFVIIVWFVFLEHTFGSMKQNLSWHSAYLQLFFFWNCYSWRILATWPKTGFRSSRISWMGSQLWKVAFLFRDSKTHKCGTYPWPVWTQASYTDGRWHWHEVNLLDDFNGMNSPNFVGNMT